MEPHRIVGARLHGLLFVQLVQKLFLVLVLDAFAALATHYGAANRKCVLHRVGGKFVFSQYRNMYY